MVPRRRRLAQAPCTSAAASQRLPSGRLMKTRGGTAGAPSSPSHCHLVCPAGHTCTASNSACSYDPYDARCQFAVLLFGCRANVGLCTWSLLRRPCVQNRLLQSSCRPTTRAPPSFRSSKASSASTSRTRGYRPVPTHRTVHHLTHAH